MNGMDFGAIMELVNGILGATKPKADGQEGTELDLQKVGLVVAAFAGRQGLSWFFSQRNRNKQAKLVAKGISVEQQNQAKKGGKFLPGLLVGAGLGLSSYLALMKPEDREALFKSIDKIIEEALGLVNEFQGKPYSRDYQGN